MIRLLLAASVAALLASSVCAQPGPAHPKPAKVLVLVTSAEVNPRLIIPLPPVEGSPEALAEIAELRRDIAGASPERLARAKWDGEHESPELLAPTLGPAFNLANLPATAKLLALVQQDADASASAAKALFPRKRPWAVDPTISTCNHGDKPLNSYPSGHALLGYSLGLAMAQVMPQKADALLLRARDYAYSREVCGAHFPSDVQASEALSSALIYTLLSKPEFQAEIAAAKAELTAKSLIAR